MSSLRVEDRDSHSGSGSRSHISQPRSEGISEYSARLESFENYPLPHHVNILHLAKHGFKYTPTARSPWGVTCIRCSKVVSSWKEGDQPFKEEFHNTGCHFVRAQTPSGHSGSINSMSENLIRASVNSNEESTKPLETASTSGTPFQPQSYPQAPQRGGGGGGEGGGGVQAYIQAQASQARPARNAFSMPAQQNPLYAAGIQPTQQLSLARVQSYGEGGSTSHVELIQTQHSTSGSYRSYSPAPPSSFVPSSFHGANSGSFHGASSGAFSRLSFPVDRPSHSSYLSHPQEEYENPSLPSRLENQEQLEDIINNLDMRVAQNRLYTFQQFWSDENEFTNYRLLVVCGFYCLGQGDAVECFCCHVTIANWSRNDNPRTRHIEMSQICRFMKDEDCGDVPLALERRRPARLSPSRGLSHSSSYQSQRSRHHPLSAPRAHHLSPHHSGHFSSSPRQSLISQPSMEGALGPAPAAHSSIQGSAGRLAESYSHPTPAAHSSNQGSAGRLAESYSHPTPAAHSSIHGSAGRSAESYFHPTPSMYQRNNLFTAFPCANPANPAMREEHTRLQTFSNQEFRRRTRLQASNQVLAQAGLYYVGDGDRVKCWFCDGGLREFQPQDDPWVEHAKFFPRCDFLLQQRGPDWINAISVQNPNVNRPIFPTREPRVLPQVVSSPTPLPPPPVRIEDPNQLEQYRNQLLEEGMQSEPAQRAREMGYSDDRIRNAQWQKILMDDCCYQSPESLINALTPDNQPDSSSGSSAFPVSPSVPPVVEMPGQNIHFQDSVFGPSFTNGQFFPPPSHGNNIHYSSTTFSTPGTGLYINGQPMQEIMDNAFDHPFFRGEMNHLMNGNTTVIHSNHPPASVHYPSPQTPSVPPRRAAPTAPRPPLQAMTIPRRSTPGVSNAATTTNAPTTSSNTSASSATGGETPQRRLETLERERTCKICLNAQSDILFQPCGHICSCENCSRMLNSCPVCRAPIARSIKTYHS